MKHDLNILMIFVIKEKCIILTHTMYCCLLLLLMTEFVLQGLVYDVKYGLERSLGKSRV